MNEADVAKIEELRKKSGCDRCGSEFDRGVLCRSCIGYVPYGGEPVEKSYKALYFPEDLLPEIETFIQNAASTVDSSLAKLLLSEKGKQVIDFCRNRDWKIDRRPK